jgi:hypothetical protein
MDTRGLPQPPNRNRLPLARTSTLRAVYGKKRGLTPGMFPTPTYKEKKKYPNPSQVYRPPDKGKVWTNDPREIMALIGEFAREKKVIIIQYRKATSNNMLVTRSLEPYALRIKDTKSRGRARFFYAYDVDGPSIGIHSFLVTNIVSVQGTDKTYRPRWPVEF